jgi:nicotinate-nucleotide pyrophosphorylase (carboxylating)
VAEGDRVAAGTVLATLAGRARAPAPDPRILDTRKTIPGLREAQKYAVRVGGGENHRMGLYDAVMLKENHVRAAGSIASAIAAARSRHPTLPLIVEVETLAQLREALAGGCDRILIDDFDAAARREAVRIAGNAPFNGAIPLEVSGSVDLAGVRAIARDGVDCISIGALTKHVRAIDLSMKLGEPPR